MAGLSVTLLSLLKCFNPVYLYGRIKKHHYTFIQIHCKSTHGDSKAVKVSTDGAVTDLYILGLSILGSILLYPGGKIAYIDTLFFACGAATQSGLNT